MPKKKLTKYHKETLIRILRGVMNDGYMSDGNRNLYSDLIERIENT